MGLEKHFTHYRYDANFLYPTSYVYDLTNAKMETKGETDIAGVNHLTTTVPHSVQLVTYNFVLQFSKTP